MNRKDAIKLYVLAKQLRKLARKTKNVEQQDDWNTVAAELKAAALFILLGDD